MKYGCYYFSTLYYKVLFNIQAVALARQSLYVKFDPLVGPQPVKNSAERVRQLEQLNMAYQSKSKYVKIIVGYAQNPSPTHNNIFKIQYW